jgi:hypothetical protein
VALVADAPCPALVELASGVVDGAVVGVDCADVTGTVDVDAPRTAGVELDPVAAPAAGAPDTAGVEVELTNGSAWATYDPSDCTA